MSEITKEQLIEIKAHMRRKEILADFTNFRRNGTALQAGYFITPVRHTPPDGPVSAGGSVTLAGAESPPRKKGIGVLEYPRQLFERPLPSNRLPVKKGIIVFVLDNFHAAAQVISDRMFLLKAAAEMIAETYSYVALKARRYQFNRIKNEKFPLVGLCWACGVNSPTERHHILTLGNGGPITRPRNIVLLCGKCHEEVHPWMAGNPVSTSRIAAAREQIDGIWKGIESRKWNKEDTKTALKHLIDALYDKEIQPSESISIQ
jgi:hypothetical protein